VETHIEVASLVGVGRWLRYVKTTVAMVLAAKDAVKKPKVVVDSD